MVQKINAADMTVEEFKQELAAINKRVQHVEPKSSSSKNKLSKLTLTPSNHRFYNGRTKK